MDYYTTSNNPEVEGVLAGIGTGTLIVMLVVAVFMVIALWKIYEKAGKPGWAAIVPIYDLVVMLEIVKLDWWHILIMLFVPFASAVYAILIPIKLSKAFGKGTGFAVLAVLLPIVAYPILAFGDAKYEG